MLAIVIPYYNYEFFKETLDSLANQTNKNFKVYIGDDASTNNPLELINNYKEKINLEYKRFSTNLGGTSLVKQWDRCIEMINNEPWIQILGDDDVLDYNSVATFYENLNSINLQNINVVRYASRYIDEKGNPLKGYSDFFHPKIELANDAFYRNFKGISRSSLSEHIFNRVVYEKQNFFEYPLAWYSDDRAWLDFSNFKNIYTINEAIVSVRVSNVSITGKNSNHSIKNTARYMFFKYLVFEKLQHFNNYQKTELLLTYGIIIKEEHKITFYNILRIFFKLILIGSFIAALKFVRRMFIAKFKKTN